MSESMREKILKATASIIASEGLDAVSIRYVCDRVGVKAPTIYYYFEDKNGLIDAVIGLAYQKHIEIYAEFVKDRSSLRGLIKTWESFFAFVEKDPELYHAIVVAHLKQRIPKEGLELFESIANIFKKLEDQKRLRLPYVKAAEVFYASAYGQALVYVSQNKNPSLKQSIRFTRDMCIRGLII
jgi:AcrR family transcriptional regulator